MGEFDENPNDNVDYKDYLGDNPSEDLNTQIKEELESMDVIEEDSDSSLNDMGNDELLEQQGFDESYAEDTEQTDKEEPYFERMSDDELREQYGSVRSHDAALGDQYVKYDEQIGQLSSDKPYYSEKEWNSYMDEKIKAQNDVSARRLQIQSEMRAIEKELDKRNNI